MTATALCGQTCSARSCSCFTKMVRSQACYIDRYVSIIIQSVMDNLKLQARIQLHIAGVRTAAGCGGEAGGGEQGRHVQRLLRHLRHHLLPARPLLLRLQRCGGSVRGQESGDCQYRIDIPGRTKPNENAPNRSDVVPF